MKLLFYSLFLSLALASCNIINPDEQEPAYLQVESYSVSTTAGQGTASDKITEIWTYTNDNILNVTSLGSQTPVLNLGPTKVSIRAGIKNYGSYDMRIYYPFFQPFDTIIDFKPLEYHKIHAKFQYYPNVVIDATRNFESGSTFLSVDGLNQGVFEVINDPTIAFEGHSCAKAYLTNGNSSLFFKEENPIQIESGNTTFLEMNFSCTAPFTVGVVSTVGGSVFSNDMTTMAATATSSLPTWNKIYIDLSPIGLLYPTASAHHLYIICQTSIGDNPIIYLDNLKLVSWP